MKILLVHCHPVGTSYSAALRDRAQASLRNSGHEVRLIDLYRDGFDPVMSESERLSYLTKPEINVAGVQSHVDALRWAEGLLFVYPTWFYGPPSMLKGWMERTWLPGIAFTIPKQKGQTPGPGMQHIRWLCCITTSGSPWWWLKVISDPGRKLFVRGLRPLFGRRCKVQWLQLFSMNNVTDDDRRRFLTRVDNMLSTVR